MPTIFTAFEVQSAPTQIVVALLPGRFLLSTTTPSWRLEDPHEGFQRTVSQDRAKRIAANVIDQGRSFPNAIVLATDRNSLDTTGGSVNLDDKIRFLVVDGQHRLWAHHYAKKEASYICVIHMGLAEQDMARLFVEINDNQKRVPSSLRWDLVRLVRPNEDPYGSRAADLIYELTSERNSPLYQRIDLTGEDKSLVLKQGSIAPELNKLVKSYRSPINMNQASYDEQWTALHRYFSALRQLDPEGWNAGKSNLYQNRVLRAFLQLYPYVCEMLNKDATKITTRDLIGVLSSVRISELASERIRDKQGSAGIAAIRKTLESYITP